MKHTILFACVAMLLAACHTNSNVSEGVIPAPEETAIFACNDHELEQAYTWARKMALSYAHDGVDDPVGPWYEAALPQREAFCMRDVSHQSVGAQILGLSAHNYNMFHRFAENISEAKDWCTYWEINRYNQPAPADYLNDKEFWYNLNANFDVMQACLKMSEWTGNQSYLNDSTFTYFYEKSVSDYLTRWQLEPERIMERPPYLNQPSPMDMRNDFHTCRGLPSYVENFRGLTLGVDLLATLQAGWRAYAEMALIRGEQEKAAHANRQADAYRLILDGQWWSEANQYYQTFWTVEGKFYRGEGIPSILKFNATDKVERMRACVTDILSKPDWNVENLSAFPALFYRLGYPQQALRILKQLPKEDRAAYPEVSYGIVEGVACGVMGLMPSATDSSLTTCAHLEADTLQATLKGVPLWDGSVTVTHQGWHATTLTNQTGRDLEWIARFMAPVAQVTCDGKSYTPAPVSLISGEQLYEVRIALPQGATLTAEAELLPSAGK